jgi:hypothetical protein
MNYDSMSLVDLKKVAKTRRIKMYYTMKRHDLIRLLSMPELPESFKLEKLTIVQLREQAKEKGLRGFWTLSRSELMNLLYPPLPTKQKNEDRNQEDEHDDPKA